MPAVTIPAAVYAGLEAVRQSGLTNMFDRHRVMRLAAQGGHHATVAWLDEHRDLYAQGICNGFHVAEEGAA